jgi:hypothetical protein
MVASEAHLTLAGAGLSFQSGDDLTILVSSEDQLLYRLRHNGMNGVGNQDEGSQIQRPSSGRDDIWLSRAFWVTGILSGFIGALTVGMLLGEPDFAIMLFGAVGGIMVGAVFFFVVAGVIRLLFESRKP